MTGDQKQYQYIEFVRQDVKKRLTLVYHCRNIKSRDLLGFVQWSRNWKQYCFYPEGSTIFNRGCLMDVYDFLDGLMEDRRG